MTVWQWDPSLYSGSADYYATGRMPYPPSVVQAIRQTLGLDGTGRLLDVGAGPGSLTIPLAGYFAETVALDADPEMVEAGETATKAAGVQSISWHALRAEELPADLGTFRVVTFAQSFHWLDQRTVAGVVAEMLDESGWVVHVAARTDKGTGETPRTPLRFPQPPWAGIDELVARYLGEERRAGQGVRPTDAFGTEREVFAAAGFGEPETVEVPHNVARVRTADEIVAAVYSLSYSAPHLFGDRKPEFEADLRNLLHEHAAFGGLFAEQVGSVVLTFFKAPAVNTSEVKAPAGKAPAGKAPRKTASKAASKTPSKTSAARKTPAPRKASTTGKAPATGKTPTPSRASATIKAPTTGKTPTPRKAPATTKAPTTGKTPTPRKAPATTKAPTTSKAPAPRKAPASKAPARKAVAKAGVAKAVVAKAVVPEPEQGVPAPRPKTRRTAKKAKSERG